MYRLTQNGQTLAQEETLSGLWPRVLRLCGHMTLDNFNRRGYKIVAPKHQAIAPALSEDRREYSSLAEKRASLPLNDVERSEQIRRQMAEIAVAYRRYTGRHIADDINAEQAVDVDADEREE